MKRKLYIFVIFVLLGTIAMAQEVIKQASVAPVIDGVEDALWANVAKNSIEKPFQAEIPSIGAAGTTYWKGLCDADGIYIIVKVNDDSFYPSYLKPGSASYEYDLVELYFDVNAELKDGLGCDGGAGANDVFANQGHYQLAPAFKSVNVNGEVRTRDNGVITSFLVTNPTYVCEYFIPWALLLDKDGIVYSLDRPMGFDVTVVDRDGTPPNLPTKPDRARNVWANVGGIDEPWMNMNDCGQVTFEKSGSSAANANVLVWNFEDATLQGMYAGTNGGAGVVPTCTVENVANPDKNGINLSALCAKINVVPGQEWQRQIIATDSTLDWSKYSRFEFDMYEARDLPEHNLNSMEVKLRNSLSAGDPTSWAFTEDTARNVWKHYSLDVTQMYAFDYSDIRFTNSNTLTYYLDNVKLVPKPLISYGFEDGTMQGFYAGTNGGAGVVPTCTVENIANPDQTGINTSALCAKIVVVPGQEWQRQIIKTDSTLIWTKYSTFEFDMYEARDLPEHNLNSMEVKLRNSLSAGNPTSWAFTEDTTRNVWKHYSLDVTQMYAFDYTDIRFTNSNTLTYYIDNVAFITSDTKLIGGTVGLKQNKVLTAKVYPNPVIDMVRIQGKDNIKAIFVYDITGRMRKSVNPNSYEAELNLSNMPTGIYFLKIQTEKGIQTQKIVKQ